MWYINKIHWTKFGWYFPIFNEDHIIYISLFHIIRPHIPITYLQSQYYNSSLSVRYCICFRPFAGYTYQTVLLTKVQAELNFPSLSLDMHYIFCRYVKIYTYIWLESWLSWMYYTSVIQRSDVIFESGWLPNTMYS